MLASRRTPRPGLGKQHDSPSSLEVPRDQMAENEKKKRRQSMVDEKRRRRSMLPMSAEMVNQVEQEEAPLPVSKILSPDEMNKRFEEWMKIAADNKINAANSWNLALIDYFHDMNILRDGDSINFQKASCTLDGCVKVYTSRIDSVASETGKLLSGLADTGETKEETEETTEEGAEGTTKRKTTRTAVTLEKDFSHLNVKKFDLEFSVDPLFKKTCADFDEGGARGLLLNHLSMSDRGMIVFDAGDALVADDEDTQIVDSKMDLYKLKIKFVNYLQDVFNRELCPSLSSFEFNSGTTDLKLDLFNKPDLFAVNDDVGDAFDDVYDDFGLDLGPEPVDDLSDQEDGAMVETEYGDHRKVILSMQNDGQDDDVFSYFERGMKNWAGPDHWRMRPLKAKTALQGETETKKREKKTFVIDFLDGEDLDERTLFQKGSSIPMLPKDASTNRHLLPDDVHFQARDLLKLFLKPDVTAKFLTVQKPKEDTDEATPEFWADRMAGDVSMSNSQNPTSAVETNTFYDEGGDFDDFGYDDDDNAGPGDVVAGNLGSLDPVESGNYGDQLVAQPKKVNKLQINYARTAKRVDVKKLKDNIWKTLSDGGNKDEMSREHQFTDVIKDLKKAYPENKLKDISVAFCFICLLHLANEKHLEIDGEDSLRQLHVRQA